MFLWSYYLSVALAGYGIILYSRPKLEKSKVTMQKVKSRVKWHPVIIKIKIKVTKNNFQPFKTRSKQQ